MNVKSEYDMGSLITIRDYIEYAKQKELGYIMFSDTGTLHHLYETLTKSRENGLRPVIGVEFLDVYKKGYSITLYPRNQEGCKRLISLSSLYNSEYKMTRAAFERELANFNIVIDTSNSLEETIELIRHFRKHNNKNQIFLGLKERIENGKFVNEEKNVKLIQVAKKIGIKIIKNNNIYFLRDSEIDLANIYRQIKNKDPVDIENALENQDALFPYLEKDDLEILIKETSSAFFYDVTGFGLPDVVAEDKDLSPLFVERYKVWAKNKTKTEIIHAHYLFKTAIKQFKKKFGNNKKVLEDVLKELDLIIKRDFSKYFLNVAEIIALGKKNNVIFGPGRGSAVSSLVAYLLDITNINPKNYNLQFERFLNENRQDMPDIDIDVSKSTRDLFIEIIKKKYQHSKVAQIMTKNNYGLTALKEITNVKKYPQELISDLQKWGFNLYDTKEEFLNNLHHQRRKKLLSTADGRQLVDYLFKIKELPRNVAVHAAGIIISDRHIAEIVPTFNHKGTNVTQITNADNALEKLGLIKIDILSVEYLDILDRIKKDVKKDFIPKNDKETFELFNKGLLAGIFQMESEGMKTTAQKIGVKNFTDLVILNSIYRPGPMSIIPQYIEKEGRPINMYSLEGNEIKGTEELITILKDTRGFIVFQEQVNEIISRWTNISLAEADMLRRSLSNEKDIKKVKLDFIQKSLKNNRDKNSSAQIFDLISRFSKYSYNKGHAVAYSTIAYEAAYFKTKHPLEFYKNLLNLKEDDGHIEEMIKRGIVVEPLDLNTSPVQHEVRNGTFYIGLKALSGAGLKTANKIIAERNKAPFKDYEDIEKRLGSDIAKQYGKYKYKKAL